MNSHINGDEEKVKEIDDKGLLSVAVNQVKFLIFIKNYFPLDSIIIFKYLVCNFLSMFSLKFQ